jgi:hypothetical protein
MMHNQQFKQWFICLSSIGIMISYVLELSAQHQLSLSLLYLSDEPGTAQDQRPPLSRDLMCDIAT